MNKIVKESLNAAEQYQVEILVDQINELSTIIPLNKIQGLIGTTIILLKKYPVEQVKKHMIELVEEINKYK